VSGISVSGATRGICGVNVSGAPHLLFLRNDDTPVLISQKSAR